MINWQFKGHHVEDYDNISKILSYHHAEYNHTFRATSPNDIGKQGP